MATRLYLRALNTFAVAPIVGLGTNSAKLSGTNSAWQTLGLQTTKGLGVSAPTTNTVAGPTNGVEVDGLANPFQWFSDPVSADVSISGAITGNLWASESSMNANVAINFVVEVVRATNNSLVNIVTSARTTEVAVTTRAVNNFTATPGSAVTVNRGDRLRIRIFGDDSTANMGSGFTFDIGYDGPTNGVDGDSYIEFTETFSFESAPSGSTLYLTNTQSGLSGAPTLVSDFTGADENPLSEGGNWAILNSSLTALQRLSNAVTGTGGLSNFSYWTPANFGPDLDAYVTVTATAGTAGFGIGGRIQGEGGAGTWDGYTVHANTTTTTISRVTNATFTTLLSISTTWANGDKLGMRIEGSTIQAWRQASGSSEWNLVATAVDTTYASAGKIALLAFAVTSATMDDFYAATDSNLFTQEAWTSRGAGVVSYVSATQTGWVSPLQTNEWFTKQLQAFTLGGLAKMNLRANENSSSANAAARVEIAVVDSDGTNASVWGSWMGALAEYGTSEEAQEVWISGDDTSVTDGQRLRIRLYVDDASNAGPMATSFTVTNYYNGTSGGASGDTYLILPQTVSEFSADSTPPSETTNLSAIGVSFSQINLSWSPATDDVGVSTYRVERCIEPGCLSFAEIGTSTTTGYQDSGLLEGHSYSYRVRARDAAANNGPYSNIATAKTFGWRWNANFVNTAK